MNYKSFKITKKHILIITLIGLLFLVFLLKAMWYSSEGVEMLEDKINKIDNIRKSLNTSPAPIDALEAVTTIQIKRDYDGKVLTPEGQKKLRELLIDSENKKKEFKIQADDIYNKITKSLKVFETDTSYVNTEQKAIDSYNNKLKITAPNQQFIIKAQMSGATNRLAVAKNKLSTSEKELDSNISDYINLKNTMNEWVMNTYQPNIDAIVRNDTIQPVTAPAQDDTLRKPEESTYSIQEAAPNYPEYKFKGCWTYGNDTQYPILNKMVASNIPNMSDCVRKVSQIGLQSAAYDGKNLCIGGGSEYTQTTPINCDNTYTKDKSWLVYSKIIQN
jgi:hypothetical protein